MVFPGIHSVAAQFVVHLEWIVRTGHDSESVERSGFVESGLTWWAEQEVVG